MHKKALLVAALICTSAFAVGHASAASKGEVSIKSHRAQKQIRHQLVGMPRVPVATAYRNHPWPDPSFDRNGRPYKPNFYSPCTVDLGYGPLRELRHLGQ